MEPQSEAVSKGEGSMFRLRILIVGAALLNGASPEESRLRRINEVTRLPGFAAFWDFVLRDEAGRFEAWLPNGKRGLPLDARNYVKDYWGIGRDATLEDFPLLGSGPFGQAIEIRNESDPNFRPVLLLPRSQFHGSAIDVSGPGNSVSMVAWVVHNGGNHAIAGIWHEGTDLSQPGAAVQRIENGRRQYAIFAGLAANNGASAAHVSENGGPSFGDKYARNLAVTSHRIAPAPAWSVVGFTFDNASNTVTAYIDGRATPYWIDNPQQHPFFKWPAEAWRQGKLHSRPGTQDGENPSFPADQYYLPPETKIVRTETISRARTERVILRTFPFTKVRVTLRRDEDGRWTVFGEELVALKVNPFWFAHDLFSPGAAGNGGPFTIGRVIHSSRGVGFTGWIGGVAVFDRALSAAQMRRLARKTVLPMRIDMTKSGVRSPAPLR
ncbi:MAG: hypothetical protein R2762_14290 [Bryobacteraceae bacterium]